MRAATKLCTHISTRDYVPSEARSRGTDFGCLVSYHVPRSHDARQSDGKKVSLCTKQGTTIMHFSTLMYGKKKKKKAREGWQDHTDINQPGYAHAAAFEAKKKSG